MSDKATTAQHASCGPSKSCERLPQILTDLKSENRRFYVEMEFDVGAAFCTGTLHLRTVAFRSLDLHAVEQWTPARVTRRLSLHRLPLARFRGSSCLGSASSWLFGHGGKGKRRVWATKKTVDAADTPNDMLPALRRAKRIRKHHPAQSSTLGGLEWL
ncbi:hypothetical protein [Paraburkholderia tropica]|uniref:hypothetical protein n=1 Tax=Paraburkholderia tropica TaxID=92647 RepID=UPI002AB3201D|nr:hypothetical protein [Paraburkholderia tropica]